MDRQTLKETYNNLGVLHIIFFHEKEIVIEFLDNFTEILKFEIILFTETVEPEIIQKRFINLSRCASLFTCHF